VRSVNDLLPSKKGQKKGCVFSPEKSLTEAYSKKGGDSGHIVHDREEGGREMLQGKEKKEEVMPMVWEGKGQTHSKQKRRGGRCCGRVSRERKAFLRRGVENGKENHHRSLR